MLKRKLKEPTIVVLTVVSVFLIYFALSISIVFASGGSIAMVNYFPEDTGTYESIDHFLEQATAVNTNTTISVSIDGEPLIAMAYQGIRNEIVPGDTVTRGWHTWEVAIPAITAPGKHTFQFFSHYYVWQEVDHYWAEFDSYSDLHSFTIAYPSTSPNAKCIQTPSPTVSPSSSTKPSIPVFPQLFIPSLFAVSALLLGIVCLKKLNRGAC